MIRVLIVEDDPMVAEINKRYLEEIAGFALVGVAHSVNDALTYIDNEQIDLVLLDVYMPGESGIELLSYIREREKSIDVILITAASDVEKVQTALRFGVVDYLIKPFEFERFKAAISSYREQFLMLHNQRHVNQKDIDEMLLSKEAKSSGAPVHSLPKGLTKSTLQIVVSAIEEMGKIPFSTEAIAEKTEISRVSIGKYLKFLKEIKVLEETITYGIGRPVSLYMYKEVNRSILNNLL
ncbi:response regulator of citrate/malate metabolism [Schinkia azotoformans MEV2011]|uniref:Response regulator of citrate/malate metabolism n=1 Tax=Schinkia azotoformans MEV2011 TaxID=1348973 RepID=A0A072NNL8_SCHAZ|nr:response regulator [Schinkia azotoformans]KEF39026.1 response regulator of citrate/malate metabolism [Schinkia azotoformans MEV2011]MEC1697350.1 response regulator [Schinkia azotoformans]MEC1724378.1 response regulator [Schinkia azotoformans]MEC1779826.1 response regulator [Schinkia azotoformans]MED4331754.1 response regulator [Schinkia azotoformans]